MMAGQLFARALPSVTEFSSPRAWAFGLLGIHEYLRRLGGDSQVNQARETLTARLMELYDGTRTPTGTGLRKSCRTTTQGSPTR
jgi:hypothetical protein